MKISKLAWWLLIPSLLAYHVVSVATPQKQEKSLETYYGKNERIISGKHLIYVMAAHAEFIKTQPNLVDFDVLIDENDDETDVRITFVPNQASNERPSLGGRTLLGRSVTYYISKADKRVTRFHYHR